MCLRSSVVLLTCVLVGTLQTYASFPIVERSQPLGVVRGEETTIVFQGARLKDTYDAIADLPGINIIEVKAIDSSKAEVKLKADAKVAPGLYPIRLITRSGISNIRLLGVGSMPITQEVEPNNDFDSPQRIEMDTSKKSYGTTIEGIADREDIDFYQFEMKAGQRLTAEIEGIRLTYSINNQNILDPYIAILDQGRFELASSDDSTLLGQDGICSFVAPQDGRYTVVVRDSSFGGSPVCGYRLHVGSFPRPVAAIPGGGVNGSTLQAELISVDGSSSTARVELPTKPTVSHLLSSLRPTDRWGVVTEDETGISPSPNWIRVNDLQTTLEAEPNNNFKNAPLVVVPAALCGVIDQPGDFDCFAFEAKKGDKYRVQCFAREPLRSPLDAVMNVFGPDSKAVASSDDVGESKDPLIEFTCAADGRYTVRVYDHLRGGSAVHQYRIEVVKAEPTFTTFLKETRRDCATVAAVPIGGHSAVIAMVTRKGYNGEISFAVDGLPEGVTAQCFPMPAGRAESPILFTATDQAKHQSGFFRIDGSSSSADAQKPGAKKDAANVTGLPMVQRHRLVLGQNRKVMFDYYTDFAAMAITDAAPFQIELVQPATPIVRSGSKSLKVKIVRDQGFEDEVRLRTLYNPPGIAVNNSRKIEKGKSETAIPMTANTGAAIGKWPIILIATYRGEQGNVEVSTPAIMLDVQQDFFAYQFPRAAAEQGAGTTVAINLDIKRELPGTAEIELAGLPTGVTSPAAKQTVTADTKVVSFPIEVSKNAKPGNHKTLVCVARVKVGDEVIVQTTGTGQLRIDTPLAPKKKKPMTEKAPPRNKADQKAKPKSEKPLSRLQQLRQIKEQE